MLPLYKWPGRGIIPDTAVTSAYATDKAGPLLAKCECLYCDSSWDKL